MFFIRKTPPLFPFLVLFPRAVTRRTSPPTGRSKLLPSSSGRNSRYGRIRPLDYPSGGTLVHSREPLSSPQSLHQHLSLPSRAFPPFFFFPAFFLGRRTGMLTFPRRAAALSPFPLRDHEGEGLFFLFFPKQESGSDMLSSSSVVGPIFLSLSQVALPLLSSPPEEKADLPESVRTQCLLMSLRPFFPTALFFYVYPAVTSAFPGPKISRQAPS